MYGSASYIGAAQKLINHQSASNGPADIDLFSIDGDNVVDHARPGRFDDKLATLLVSRSPFGDVETSHDRKQVTLEQTGRENDEDF